MYSYYFGSRIKKLLDLCNYGIHHPDAIDVLSGSHSFIVKLLACFAHEEDRFAGGGRFFYSMSDDSLLNLLGYECYFQDSIGVNFQPDIKRQTHPAKNHFNSN